MDATEKSEGRTAREVLDRLEERYRAFSEAAGSRVKPKLGLAGVFEKWFRSPGPSEPQPMFTDFLKSVQALSEELAEALRGASAEERSEAGFAAARIMLASKPTNDKSEAEWYMIAAEYSFSALIPVLAPDTLRAIRDDYKSRTPKRMMFPRQLELLKRMERALG